MTSSHPSRLIDPPLPPQDLRLGRAYLILLQAHSASYRFAGAFVRSVEASVSVGEEPDEEAENYLRAMLVFASAGLDSMVKRTAEDALPSLIKQNAEAREGLRDFVEGQLGRKEQPDYKMLTNLLVAESPVDEMTALLVRHLTDNSLQSVDMLLRAVSFFAIEPISIVGNPNALRDVFRIRNEIIHDMDVDPSRSPSAKRTEAPEVNVRPRDYDSMVAAANQILEVADAFLAAVDAKLADG